MEKRNSWTWMQKEERKVKAEKQTLFIEKNYKKEVETSVRYTRIYVDTIRDSADATGNKSTKIEIESSDTVSALYDAIERGYKNIAVLNFASYKNPGGMFLEGSMAQEEAICHESILYNVLREFEDSYYAVNRKCLNKALYTNKALYSAKIYFNHNSVTSIASVITCAAPNASTARKYQKVSEEEINKTMDSRIKFILQIAKNEKRDTLVLGAFGAGVFGNDPYVVAGIFKKYLETDFKNIFSNIIFAIPGGDNLKAFEETFNN